MQPPTYKLQLGCFILHHENHMYTTFRSALSIIVIGANKVSIYVNQGVWWVQPLKNIGGFIIKSAKSTLCALVYYVISSLLYSPRLQPP